MSTIREVKELPTYGYQCTQCQHEFQVFQSMKDEPIAVCPECNGKVKRLLYPVGVVFKGSGWYINDSRKPEKSEASEAKADATKSDETKSAESKPAETASGGEKKEAAPAASAKE